MSIEPLDGTENALDLGDLPPMEITPAPGFLRFMPELIQRLHSIGGKVSLNDDGTMSLDGFYKNGPLRLEIEEGPKANIVAVDKRGRRKNIATLDDLVLINFSWLKISNGKGVFLVPERPWLDQFIEKKWVRRKIVWEPREDDGEPEA
jgi:hypothetical protein